VTKHGRPLRVLVAAILTLAMIAPIWWLLAWFIAWGQLLAKPFPTARGYITDWFLYSVILSIPFAAIALCIAIPLSHPKRWRGARTLQVLNWLWVVAPLHIFWCVASLLHASYAPGFHGFTWTGKLPAEWKAPLALASSSFAFVAVSLVAATFVLFRPRRAHAAAKAAPDPSSVCDRCGYPRSGLAGTNCPECGNLLADISQSPSPQTQTPLPG
jgi:hypothetical protein